MRKTITAKIKRAKWYLSHTDKLVLRYFIPRFLLAALSYSGIMSLSFALVF